ncbi:retrovirus-related pol polyprotein from transposon TNT 1-94 [Tanacetum coccineum]
MEQAVEQHRLESKTFEVKMNQVLNEKKRLLEQVINKDIVNVIMNSSADTTSVNVHECEKCLKLETELQMDFIEKEIYDKLFKSFTTLEKHCISLEVDSQLYQEIFQRDNSVSNQSAPSFDQLFALKEFKAQSQEKDTIIKEGVKPSTSARGSQPSGNTKKYKILQTPSSTQKNKVEAHPRKVKSSLKNKDCVVEPKGTAHVQHSKLNANFELKCVKSSKLFSVKFKNDHVAKILGYGDYQIGNVTISRVDYVEGLGHNLFSVGQFCDSNLEVSFRQHTCFICNLEGVDLLTGSRGNNLYALSLGDMMASSPICLLSKASKTKSWLWHRRLSHLNFGAINHLARYGLFSGLLKLKFEKDHLCFACAMGKSKKKPHKPKSEDTNQEKLYLLHMDLCGPMRVASVNGKKYILVIVDDYSRFTWVKCLRSKDEALDFIIKFLKMIQVRLKVPVRRIRTDNGTEFVNQTLCEYYEKVDISHETSVARSSQQNGVVERQNRTLIKAARTMLIYAKAPLFLWAEAVATAYFDELTAMASKQSSSGPALHDMTPATISLGLVPNPPPSTPFVDQDAPSPSNSQTTPDTQPPVIPNDVEEENHDIEVAHMGNDPYFGILIPEVPSDQSSSTDSIHTIMHPEHGRLPNGCQTALLNGNLRERCPYHQAWPTDKHLHAVKRIFRYLKGTINRGLWYPKDSSIALTAFAEVDHAGCQDTRHSTSGSMQLLGDRLVS